jgi:hypothetical protein
VCTVHCAGMDACLSILHLSNWTCGIQSDSSDGIKRGTEVLSTESNGEVRMEGSHRNYCTVEWSCSGGMFGVEIQIFYKSA